MSTATVMALTLLVLAGPMLEGYDKRLGRYAYMATDGDTIKRLDLVHPDRTRLIRVYGLDTPETDRAKCEQEKIAGYRARARMQELLTGHAVTVEPQKRKDKYGRLLAIVRSDGKDVAGILIGEGYGREYSGGQRQGWCE